MRVKIDARFDTTENLAAWLRSIAADVENTTYAWDLMRTGEPDEWSDFKSDGEAWAATVRIELDDQEPADGEWPAAPDTRRDLTSRDRL